jgi:hypothetical protein
VLSRKNKQIFAHRHKITRFRRQRKNNERFEIKPRESKGIPVA